MKLIGALDAIGIELIAEGAFSQEGGRGVRLKSRRAVGKQFGQSARAIADFW
jgi:hypothetical protein